MKDASVGVSALAPFLPLYSRSGKDSVMEFSWKLTTGLICCYGFFKEMKPSEPFLTPYLNSTYKHLALEELSSEVYPIWTYSYLVVLFIVFLITDALRYKPLIITEGLAYLTTRILLIWGNGILAMQFMQMAYGIATGTEVAYYSYIYALVPTEHFQMVTGYLRGAVLLGRFMAGFLGQLLISLKWTNYLVLNYVSFACVLIAFVLSIFLPMPASNMRNVFMIDDATAAEENQGHVFTRWKKSTLTLLKAFKESYLNMTLLQWSIWWALATCGYLQIGNYVQNLWEEIQGPDKNSSLNGGVEAAGTLFGAIIAVLLSFLKVRWGVLGELLLGFFSLVDAMLLIIMAKTGNVWIAYITYVCYRVSYTFLITVASFQVALNVDEHAYALIFGWNTFVALALQSIMTIVVADKRGLDLDIRNQFLVYGGYFLAISAIYLTLPFIRLVRRICIYFGCASVQDSEMQMLTDELSTQHARLDQNVVI